MRTPLPDHLITNAGGTLPLNQVTDFAPYHLFYGTATLFSGGYAVTTIGTPSGQTTYRFIYDAHVTYFGTNTVTFFGTALTAAQALKGGLLITCTWNMRTSAWIVIITDTSLGYNHGFATTNMNPAGDTIIITKDSKDVQYFISAAAPLTGNYSVVFSGPFDEGQPFFFKYAGALTLGSSTLVIAGENIDAVQALAGNCTVLAWYDSATSTFKTQLIAAPTSSGSGTRTALTVSFDGTLYPAASAGDSFVISTPTQGMGRLGTNLPVPANPYLEAPAVRIVFQNDVLYCRATTGGGDTAAAGASFYVEGAPRAMVPLDNTEGSTNYQINAPNPDPSVGSRNANGSGTNLGNGFWGYGNTVSGGSLFNWIVGKGHLLVGSIWNLVVGFAHITGAGSLYNGIVGYFNRVTGNQNFVGGQQNRHIGNDSAVVGSFHDGGADRVVVLGAGTEPEINNSIYLGGATSPASFGGPGGVQTQISKLAGAASTVIHPATSPLIVSTNLFASTKDKLIMNHNSMLWSFEAKVIVSQTGVGVAHANTSAVGDWAEFQVRGVARRVAGVTTLVGAKWLDHRNRWIPVAAPNCLAYRDRSVTGARADIALVQPSISISNNEVQLSFVFPGSSELMTDQGSGRTPQFAMYVANGDINGGVALTFGGTSATDSELPNTITTTLAPLTTATFRNPVADAFDGSDANGNGYYGGIGLGAELSVVTKPTSVASIGYANHGSYNVGVTATATNLGGNAGPFTCVMSGAADTHIGNNVVVLTGGSYTAANGSYAIVFTGGAGSGAAGIATVVANVITAINITKGGSNYLSTDVVVITCPAAGETVAATFTVTLYEQINSITFGGANNIYDNTSDLVMNFAGAGFAQAIATAQITPQTIDGAGTITVDKGGVGYGLRFPTVAVLDAGGVLYEDGNGGSFRLSGQMTIQQLKYA